jgi:predicted lipoprotein with Yx(FWY)xxD motif
MFSKGRIILAGAMAAAGCLLAACGGTSPSSASNTTSPASTPAASSTASAAASTGSGLDAALRTTTNAALGPIVIDGSGRTLYRFDKDSASPPTSNCTGACAALWPPVLVGTQINLTGINRDLLGTIKRADGTVQLTLHGWPLYRYAGDSAPGQTNGEGIGGTWFAVKPTGAKALPGNASGNASGNTGSNTGSNANTGSTTPSSAPASNSGGGYGY